MIVLTEYRKHVEERAAEGIVPKPLNADQVVGLVELLKHPPVAKMLSTGFTNKPLSRWCG